MAGVLDGEILQLGFLVALLLLLAPGLLALLVAERIRGATSLRLTLNNVLSAFVLSSIVVSAFVLIHDFSDWPAVAEYAREHSIQTFATVLVLSVAVGIASVVVVSGLLRLLDPALLRVKQFIYKDDGLSWSEGSVWDDFWESFGENPISVVTSEGVEYAGHLYAVSSKDEDCSVVLSPVSEVTYSKDGQSRVAETAQAVLLQKDDIKRVFALPVHPARKRKARSPKTRRAKSNRK